MDTFLQPIIQFQFLELNDGLHLIQNSLKIVPKFPIDNNSVLVHAMVRRLISDKLFSEAMMT